MDIEIRELLPAELPRLATLDVSECVDAYYELETGETGASLRLRRRQLPVPQEKPTWGARETVSRLELWQENHARGRKFWGAFAGKQLTGFCLLSSETTDGIPEMYSIFVDRTHRHKGIGTRLVAQAEKHCRALGLRGIYLTTTLDGSAIDFYGKIGYRVVGLHGPVFRHASGEVAFFRDLLGPADAIEKTATA